jgi:hypothetical protein
MKVASEYLAYAQECMEWAKTARSKQQRDALLEMARIWLEATHHADDSELTPPQGGVISPWPSTTHYSSWH